MPNQDLRSPVVGKELVKRFQDTWASMLGLELTPLTMQLQGPPPKWRWSAFIGVSGDWRGMVTMSCDDTVARLATAAMLGIEAEAATPAEIRDAIGEIANLMGGQTKMVLGPGSSLGLPLVIEGDGYESMVPHSYTVGTVHCECAGHLVDLSIASADRRSIAR